MKRIILGLGALTFCWSGMLAGSARAANTSQNQAQRTANAYLGSWWEECEGARIVCGKWRVVSRSGNTATLRGIWTNGTRSTMQMTIQGTQVKVTRRDLTYRPLETGAYVGTIDVKRWRARGLLSLTQAGKTSRVPWSAIIHVSPAGYAGNNPRGNY